MMFIATLKNEKGVIYRDVQAQTLFEAVDLVEAEIRGGEFKGFVLDEIEEGSTYDNVQPNYIDPKDDLCGRV